MELVLLLRWNSDEGPGEGPDEGGEGSSNPVYLPTLVRIR